VTKALHGRIGIIDGAVNELLSNPRIGPALLHIGQIGADTSTFILEAMASPAPFFVKELCSVRRGTSGENK